MTTTLVTVNTRTHSVAFVTDKMLMSIERIIVWLGLDRSKLTNNWREYENGIRTWLNSGHLRRIAIEVVDPVKDELVGRWDFEVRYSYGTDEDLEFWVDIDAIRYAMKKCGLIPASCSYQVVVTTAPGSPRIAGWEPATLKSTEGFVRQSVGTAIGASPLAAGVAYWRRV